MHTGLNPRSRQTSTRYAAGESPPAIRSRRKFLRFFPGGFTDPTYLEWERDYKWQTHERWNAALGKREFGAMLLRKNYAEIAARAVRVEQQSRHSMIFSFEKMALRDATKVASGAKAFSEGLYDFLHGSRSLESRFMQWVEVVSGLPRRQTRVLTWPLVTVFAFIAQPDTHMFLKPMVTREAARVLGFDFRYASRPNWNTYASLLEFAARVRRDQRRLKPRDMIDVQSFIWVQGSDEYR
jgi:hypothetical protein